MGYHRNHAISHSPNQNFFEDTFVSHSGGPNEQFGTREKLSCGGGGWGVQGNLNWMPGYQYKLYIFAASLLFACWVILHALYHLMVYIKFYLKKNLSDYHFSTVNSEIFLRISFWGIALKTFATI